ncbi:MAG: VOC family protein [Pseudomonadota bacterium]
MTNASFRPSHYLVRVEDLPQAVRDYEAAGFNVVWGSDPQTAHNALIYFDSGGFIELFNPVATGAIAVVQKAVAKIGAAAGQPLLQRMNHWLKSRGLCDFALESDVLEVAREEIVESGMRLTKTRDFSRRQANGVVTRWQLCAPRESQLPFLMGPYTPAPEITDTQRQHPNGIRRIQGLDIQHPHPTWYADQLAQLFANKATVVNGERIRVELEDGFVFSIVEAQQWGLNALITDTSPPADAILHGLSLLQPR